MKTFRLLAFICAVGTAGLGQAQADSSKAASGVKKWSCETGLNLYSFTVRGGDFYSNYKAVFDHYAASGLSFKFFRGKNAIRTSVDYFQKIIIERPRVMQSRDFSFKTLQVAAGYQRHFGNKKLMPYVYTDLSYGFGKELTRSFYNGPFYYLADYRYGYTSTEIRTRTFSATPGLGLRIRLGKNLILNFETAAEFFYMKQYDAYIHTPHTLTGINLKPFKASFGFTF